MINEIKRSGESTKRLHMDRKMIGILSVFAVLGVCLVVTILVATNTLSALRGFASLQTHWTEARKETSMKLVRYLETEEEQYFAQFENSIDEIESARKIRQGLLKEEPDYNAIRSSFLKIHTIPADIAIMISAFERFSEFRNFKAAMQQWIISDQIVQRMKGLAYQKHKQIEMGTFPNKEKKEAIAAIYNLDHELTQVQYELSKALSSGTHFLKNIILWVSISIGFILLATGGFLSFRFLKSLKGWRQAIEISEQKYRSLFDQNPNAVYSISKEGRFLSGNERLKRLIGYSFDELKSANLATFISESDLERVITHFNSALNGTSQTYEATGIRKDGKHFFAEITNLPIYVDGNIIGVYGIAQDISIRKEREYKIKEQLEEKTVLLAEIHDRVKNNLALISGLIQLQKESLEETQQRKILENTVSRIHSMAIVHEQLYQTENFSQIRMDEYLHEFSDSLLKDFSSEAKSESTLTLDTDPVTLGIKQAIPTALLLNELATNACKYGINGTGNAEVEISLAQKKGQVLLKVADKGPGLSEEYDMEEPKTLGFKLVSGLIKQLEATFELGRKGGTSFRVQFEKEVS